MFTKTVDGVTTAYGFERKDPAVEMRKLELQLTDLVKSNSFDSDLLARTRESVTYLESAERHVSPDPVGRAHATAQLQLKRDWIAILAQRVAHRQLQIDGLQHAIASLKPQATGVVAGVGR